MYYILRRNIVGWIETFAEKFVKDFVVKERWRYITNGLQVTLIVTLGALIIGLIIGMVVAVIRSAHDQISKEKLKSPGGLLLRLLNQAARLYLTVIRGTPSVVQLLLMYFMFLVNTDSKVLVAVITFGINSGAYVAEIFRSGIMSIDKGQMEAGRSLGLSFVKTMQIIILPQAFKNTLPALVNESITLLKETSICGYVGLNDLTRGGDIIRVDTYDPLLPLLGVAVIYLVIVMFFTWIMGKLERGLRESDRR
ncbi:MAG: amino acid ABC transporter permease [Eubacterium sp.]|nr:amino acid ABC transporter permease [Eubacterium sp.]MCI8919578.1 amino acid ABC transporter permease [Eubacterium sp.]